MSSWQINLTLYRVLARRPCYRSQKWKNMLDEMNTASLFIFGCVGSGVK
jgi:hypothetical protein